METGMEVAPATAAEAIEANTVDEMAKVQEQLVVMIWTITRTHLMTLMLKEQEEISQVLKMATVMALQELEIRHENIASIVSDWDKMEKTRKQTNMP